MSTHTRSQDEGFTRLQGLLLALKPGETVDAGEASRVSGLSEHTCSAVLTGLERAGLMAHEGGKRFVRRRLDVLT